MSDLLDLALTGHGGLHRWRELTRITATMSVRGTLLRLKGHPDGLPSVQATADTAVPRLVYSPFAGASRGVWEPERVTVETADGTPVQQRIDPRAAFNDLERGSAWDDLHLLYFTGYAMWNYLCTPFIFTMPGFTTQEIDPWDEDGQRWRRLRVKFPPSVPTHNDDQVFYFDGDGLLRRLDYTSEVVGAIPAAHYCHDHKTFAGIVIPTRRRAFPRRPDGTAAPAPTFIEIDITLALPFRASRRGNDD